MIWHKTKTTNQQYIYIYIYIYIWIYTFLYKYRHICFYIYIYFSTSIYMHIYVHIYITYYIYIYIYIYIYCDVVCYREGKGGQFPNSMEFELTGPKDWPLSSNRMKVKSYPHSITYNLLDEEKNPGHYSGMTGGNSGRRKKPNDWPDPLAPKWYLFVKGNLEKNL